MNSKNKVEITEIATCSNIDKTDGLGFIKTNILPKLLKHCLLQNMYYFFYVKLNRIKDVLRSTRRISITH